MDANAVPVGDYEFLDPRFRRLFITAQTSLYAIYLNTSP